MGMWDTCIKYEWGCEKIFIPKRIPNHIKVSATGYSHKKPINPHHNLPLYENFIFVQTKAK
jgi:hypothetical protein